MATSSKKLFLCNPKRNRDEAGRPLKLMSDRGHRNAGAVVAVLRKNLEAERNSRSTLLLETVLQCLDSITGESSKGNDLDSNVANILASLLGGDTEGEKRKIL